MLLERLMEEFKLKVVEKLSSKYYMQFLKTIFVFSDGQESEEKKQRTHKRLSAIRGERNYPKGPTQTFN